MNIVFSFLGDVSMYMCRMWIQVWENCCYILCMSNLLYEISFHFFCISGHRICECKSDSWKNQNIWLKVISTFQFYIVFFDWNTTPNTTQTNRNWWANDILAIRFYIRARTHTHTLFQSQPISNLIFLTCSVRNFCFLSKKIHWYCNANGKIIEIKSYETHSFWAYQSTLEMANEINDWNEFEWHSLIEKTRTQTIC